MITWNAWPHRALSLRRFLLAWMLGGLWLVVACVTVWHLTATWEQLANAQDERLRGALSEVAQSIAQSGTLSISEPLHAAPGPQGLVAFGRTHYRVSAMSGEWLAGDQGLAPYPWRRALPASGTPELYITHNRGTLVRAAAALRHVPGDGGTAIILAQVATPLRDRFPQWHHLFATPLSWVHAVAVAMSVVIVTGVNIATRWLDRARIALDSPQGAQAYDGPAELQPAFDHMSELHHHREQWVDEQRRFLADASHQLRTPMAVLRTQLQSAIAGDSAPAEILPQMLHTVDRAAGLANQLLSLTKLEQLRRSGELKPIDLHAAARDAVMELSPLIAGKRLDFTLEGPPLQAPGDSVMFGELLRNLLANAIHHAPQNGRLGILLREGTGRIELVVWDEGQGLDDAVRPFEPYSAGKGGVGLGLTICKQIADAMGATMNVYNRIEADKVIGVDAVVAWGQGP